MFNIVFLLQSGIISGWGYTEVTKILKPRPLTSDVLREAEIYILPQVIIFISHERSHKVIIWEICISFLFKGPLHWVLPLPYHWPDDLHIQGDFSYFHIFYGFCSDPIFHISYCFFPTWTFFKGPLGVESTCQGDSGGPLVVNTAENR